LNADRETFGINHLLMSEFSEIVIVIGIRIELFVLPDLSKGEYSCWHFKEVENKGVVTVDKQLLTLMMLYCWSYTARQHNPIQFMFY
jgi:hypothetical protein